MRGVYAMCSISLLVWSRGLKRWHKGMKRSRWRSTAIQDPIRGKKLLKSSEMYGGNPQFLCFTSHRQEWSLCYSQNSSDKGCRNGRGGEWLIAVSGEENMNRDYTGIMLADKPPLTGRDTNTYAYAHARA